MRNAVNCLLSVKLDWSISAGRWCLIGIFCSSHPGDPNTVSATFNFTELTGEKKRKPPSALLCILTSLHLTSVRWHGKLRLFERLECVLVWSREGYTRPCDNEREKAEAGPSADAFHLERLLLILSRAACRARCPPALQPSLFFRLPALASIELQGCSLTLCHILNSTNASQQGVAVS